MYKLTKNSDGNINGVSKDSAFIPFDPANTDYQQFKQQVLAGDAKLENSEGVEMTSEEAIAYIKELP